MRRAVFLDRDGVINQDTGYVHRPEEFRFVPGAPEAIKMLRDAGFLVVVVTNQSGVARGYYPLTAVHELHRYIDDQLAGLATKIDGYYICPHHPEQGTAPYRMVCACRKPLPGMLRKAAADLNIDLKVSYLVGDHLRDVLAGRAAGCRTFLVNSSEMRSQDENLPAGTRVVNTVLAAAREILDDLSSSNGEDV